MKNKTMKIVTTILMALFVLATISQVAFGAVNVEAQTPGDLGGIEQIAGKILGLIQAVSGIFAVVLIAVFGFKFIMGSANEKAEYQKSFIPLIVGVIVVFAATSIADLLMSTFTA